MILNNLLILASLFALMLILIGRNWQMRVMGLAIIDLIGFVLIIQIWPVALTSVKLIAGWMGIVIISSTQSRIAGRDSKKIIQSENIFRLLVAILLWIILIAIAPGINNWLPVPYTNLYIGLSIVVTGITFASISNDVFDIIIGILTFLAGFDIIYSSLEGSALITAIYASIIVLICLLTVFFSERLNEVSS